MVSAVLDASRSYFDQQIPHLVGREHELQALETCLDAVRQGRGRLVLIGGEVGIGKTTLARTLCRAATSHDAVVLTGHADLLAETPPYGPWAEALSRAPHGLDGLNRPSLGVASDEATNVATLFAQVRDYLESTAAERPVIVVLEDFHWADPASLDLLGYLARDLAHMSVLVIVTYRADELTRHHPLSPLIPVLVRQYGAVRLDLHRLSADETRELVMGRYALHPEDVDRLVNYLGERAEGNPLYFNEMLRALTEEQILIPGKDGCTLGDLTQMRVPALLRQVIDERVMRLGEHAYELLAIAAVIGPEINLSLWSSVSEVPEEGLINIVERGVAARVLDAHPDGIRVGFAHAMIREALYEEILPPRRRIRHRRVADVMLASDDPDPDAVAFHLQRASDPRAAEWLIRAGMRAQRSYALITAAERFDAALQLLETHGATDAERAELLYRIARMRRYADPRQAISYLDDAIATAEAASDSVLIAYMSCFRGSLLCATGALRRGLDEMQAGLRTIDAFSDSDRQRLRALQERLGEPPDEYQYRGAFANWLAVSGRASEALEEGMHVVEMEAARGIGTSGYANAWRGLASAYALLGRPEEARKACAQAGGAYQSVEHPYQIGNSHLLELFEVVLPYQADQLLERRRLAEDAERAWRRASGATVDLPPCFVWLPILVVEGGWAEARELARAARTPTRRRGWRPFATSVLAILAHAQGDLDLAWQLIHEQLPGGPSGDPGDGIFLDVVPLQRLAARLAIDSGDLKTAHSWLETHDRWLEWSGAVLGRADGHITWAIYHCAVGDQHSALRHARESLQYASNPRQPLALLAAHRIVGELEGAAGQDASAREHLEAALSLADACQARYERALTLTSIAGLLTGDDAGDVKRYLEEAIEIFTELGASPALERANAIVPRSSRVFAEPQANPAGLTARELEVLKLVVEGRTDREIADQLYISPRTVTTHITHIFTKLDVSSRTAAAALALREGIV